MWPEQSRELEGNSTPAFKAKEENEVKDGVGIGDEQEIKDKPRRRWQPRRSETRSKGAKEATGGKGSEEEFFITLLWLMLTTPLPLQHSSGG